VALSLAVLPGVELPQAVSAWQRPAAVRARELLAERQGTAAALLLSSGDAGPVWPLFRHSPDPTRRSWLVWRAGERGADPKLLIDRLLAEKDVSAKRALIVALGEYDDKALPVKEREPLVRTLLSWYRDDPDPGVHSAIGWLLRNGREGDSSRRLDWGQAEALAKIDEGLKGKPARLSQPDAPARDAGAASGWYVTSQGQTMAMIEGPIELHLGAPAWEPDRFTWERRHVKRIGRSYAVATSAVTLEQWRRFLKEQPDLKYVMKRFGTDPAAPATSVTWFMAARYCNWLSQKEGIPRDQWCYPERIVPNVRQLPNYLSRTGYRLPSEAEMECAIRAGSVESRHYGSSEALLDRYAFYRGNAGEHVWPVGQKRPNDFGLFDAHGNTWCWCNETRKDFVRLSPLPAADVEDQSAVDEVNNRALRGGSAYNDRTSMRSANRNVGRPNIRDGVSFGLRVCRTLPPPPR
jgi:formylglycine-generating enzyme required for sulfatase activity